MISHINVYPRTTEKAYGQSKNNVYVFNVPLSANKQGIIDAVETQYGVKVVGVKTIVQSGKAVRYSRGKRSYPGTTMRKDSKKAYVTLAEGNSIKVFEDATEANVETKAEKKEKK
jgi:large subunit ribosomal protein L23